LSVSACLRAGTKVDLAWVVATQGISTRDKSEALAITPGGGRIGSALHGALNEKLRTAGTHTLDVFDLLIADVAGLGGVNLLGFLFAAEADFGGVQNDHEITSVNVRGESRLGLAAQEVGGGDGDISKNLVLGVDDPPCGVLLLGFG